MAQPQRKKKERLFPVNMVLFNTETEGKNEGRLSALICDDPDQARYVSWHAMSRLNREFRQKFGKDMPGLTPCYKNHVRSKFRYDQFMAKSTMAEKIFLAVKIPENVNAYLSGKLNQTAMTDMVN